MMTWSEVERVDGYVGNFTVTIKQKPRYVIEDLCTGCGICWEKCPKKVIDNEFEAGLGYRKAVYTPFAQAVPKYPVIDTENCIYFQNGKCRACEKLCPTKAIDFTQEEEFVTVTVGNIILATGYDLFDARRIPQYGYGRLANVFTSIEFERMCNAAGPTNGEIVLRDGVTAPKSVGIVHCVGSRDRNYNNYCSVICCMSSLKFAHLVKERTGAQVYNFYIDMRTAFKDYDEFYQRVLEEGTLFVRGRVAEVTRRGPTAQRRGQAHHSGRGHARRQAAPHSGGHGHSGDRPGTAPRRQGGGPQVRHLLQRQRLVHREASQARPGSHHDRRHLHRRRGPGAEGHPGQCGPGRRRRRARAQPNLPGARSSWSRCARRSTRPNAPAAASATTSVRSTPSSSMRT